MSRYVIATSSRTGQRVLCHVSRQGAQGLQTEQQLAEAVQRATTQQTADMPVILYDEHGQALIQPYLQMQQHYEARCIWVAPLCRHASRTRMQCVGPYQGDSGRRCSKAELSDTVGNRRTVRLCHVNCTDDDQCLQMQGVKPLSTGLPMQPDMQLLQQLQASDQQPQAALQLHAAVHGALDAPHAALPLAGAAAEGHEAVLTFRQDLLSV